MVPCRKGIIIETKSIISHAAVRFLAPLCGLILAGRIVARADVLYVTFDSNNDTVEKFASGPDHADLGPFASTHLATANGLAFDRSANLYVANTRDGTITKFDPQGHAAQFATGLNAPGGLAFDREGNLYVANFGDSTVRKITSAGAATIFATGLSKPTGLAFGAGGHLYVANAGNNTISKISPDGARRTLFAATDASYTALNNPMAIAFDAGGRLYVANFNKDNVARFSPTGAALGVFAREGLRNPHGLAFDSRGHLFVANYHHTGDEGSGYSTIEEFSADGAHLSTFHDRKNLLRDASFIAMTSDSGTPLLPAGSTTTPSAP